MWQGIMVILTIEFSAKEISHNIEAKTTTTFKQIGICQKETSETFPICYCDSDCVLYGDCCIDAQIPSSTVLNLLPKERCQSFGNLGHPSFWTVDSCSGGNPTEDIVGLLPVIDKEGTVYANDNTARCNNASSSVPMDMYVFLRSDICNTDLILAFLEQPFPNLFMTIINSNCEFLFYPKYATGAFPRVCIDWRERNSERNLSFECKLYQEPVKISSVVYKNSRCFEDLHGYPAPENSTDVEDIFPQPWENEASLHIEFGNSIKNYLSPQNVSLYISL
jgi:hypothetical protein